MTSPRTLRGRLALLCASTLGILMVLYSGAVFFIVVSAEPPELQAIAPEPPEVEALERAFIARRMALGLGLGLSPALLLAAWGGLWLTRKALHPLSQVVQAAANLDLAELHQRVPLPAHAPEEVAQLVRAWNSMLDRLQRSVLGLRRFTADAAHELRTPLCTLMGQLEVTLRHPRDPAALRATLESTLEGLGGLARLTELLLLLARADAQGLQLRGPCCDAARVAGQVLETYAVVAEERGLHLISHLAGPAPVLAEPLWLSRALLNLLDNACKFTPRGGTVHVTLVLRGRHVQVQVADTGPGFQPEELERAFDRFYRGPSARGTTEGFGLGLPLARDIVRALGGELTLRSIPGSGAELVITLPCADTTPERLSGP